MSEKGGPCRRGAMPPYYDRDGIVIYHGDSRDAIPRLREHGVKLIVTDPPYETLDAHVRRGTTTRLVGGGSGGSDAWFPTLDSYALLSALIQAGRLLPRDGALYVFADAKASLQLFPPLSPANILVWDKQRIGMGYSWRRMHEWIAYCPQPAHRLRNRGLGDVLRAAPPRPKLHPTEKPIAVLSAIIENSSDPGDVVLDPFAGSGTALLAAKRLGRRAIGIEIEERYCRVAAARLDEVAAGHYEGNPAPAHVERTKTPRRAR
jgi:site-specific DNA-methyltransferase (adenine-specific)